MGKNIKTKRKKNGTIEVLVDKQMFNVRGLNNQTLIAKNPEELIKFRAEVAELNRKVSGCGNLMNEAKEELDFIIEALMDIETNQKRLTFWLRFSSFKQKFASFCCVLHSYSITILLSN